MNENELTTLLERAADRLAPDVGALVEGGTRRGRRRRRARAGAALGTAAVLAVAGVTWQAGSGGTAERTGRDPLVATASPAAPTPGAQRALPADDVLVQRLLDHLPDGEITDLTTTPVFDEPDSPYLRGLEIHLLLDGAAVEVRVSDGSVDPAIWGRSLDPGPQPEGCDASLVDADKRTWNQATRSIRPGPELTPEMICIDWVSMKREQRCAADPACLAKRTAYSPKRYCGSGSHQLADGSWLWPRSGDGGDGSDTSGFTGNWAGLCRPDGWTVDVSAFNSPDGDAREPEVLAGEPPLSLDQVTELATAGIWFE